MNIQEILSTSPSFSHWQKIGIFSHHGLCVPLFSLHSQHSVGIGEFLDLIPVIDFCSNVGFDVLQLLPLNERAEDPSPYTTISSLALDPTYISLKKLSYLQKADSHSSSQSSAQSSMQFSTQASTLTQLKELLKELQRFSSYEKSSNQQIAHAHIDYKTVKQFKENWLRRYFSCIKDDLVKETAFQKFLQNHLWLSDYALFKIFRKKHNNLPWEFWEKEFSSPTFFSSRSESLSETNSKTNLETTSKATEAPISETNNSFSWIEKQKQEHKEEILFLSALQFFCFEQMKQVKKYADQKKVLILGDFPLFISKESVDVWKSFELFNFTWIAGAPPDSFYPLGQKWGFPIFRWDRMKKNHYLWWKNRLDMAKEFYHMYRIDHVVGLFRIWAISQEGKAISGHFIPEDAASWGLEGKEHLEAFLEKSSLLPIAEDLGTIPQVTYDVLKELGICGIKILLEQNHPFSLQDYEPLSMSTLSTHDTETLALWWQNHPDKAKEFSNLKGWEFSKTLSIEQRKELIFDSHHTTSLFHANLVQEYLALRPQWISSDPEDERINRPGVMSEKNWSYRIRPSVEAWTCDENFAKEIASLIR